MTTWMLSQFYTEPLHGNEWPVAASYSNGQQIEAAEQDPRVQPYRTPWDTITPETVSAYASAGAVPGMMLGQLLTLLARICHVYSGGF